MYSVGVRPSFATGFAQWPGQSEYPQLWKGLVAGYAPFLGMTGGKLLDWSGNNNTGSLVDGPVWGTGKYGSNIFFDGSNDIIQIPKAVVTTYPITLIAWYKTSSGGFDYSYPVSVCNSGSNVNHWGLWSRNNVGFIYHAGANDVITGGSIAVNTHYMIAGVSKTATDHYLYLDGVQIGTGSGVGNVTGIDRAAIGAFWDSTPLYGEGEVEMVMIFNRDLSASEIALLYQLRKRLV